MNGLIVFISKFPKFSPKKLFFLREVEAGSG